MIAEVRTERTALDHRSLLAQAAALIETKPFIPHRFFQHGDAQTIGAFLWPARIRLRDMTGDEERLFEVEPGSRVLAGCRWQPDRAASDTSAVAWPGRFDHFGLHVDDRRQGLPPRLQRGAGKRLQFVAGPSI